MRHDSAPAAVCEGLVRIYWSPSGEVHALKGAVRCTAREHHGHAVAVALPASLLVLNLLDPVPDLPPDPLFAVPWTSLAAVLTGVVLVTVLGAVLVGRAARRATGGQVMRDAT